MTSSRTERRTTPTRILGALLGMVLGLTFVASMLTIVITVAIWPGEAVLTAPLLCPDHQPDAFVVSDTVSVQPGETSTNFTLYCVGPRGDFTDAGFLRSFLLLMAAHAVIVIAVALMSGMVAGRRRRARRAAQPSALPG